MLVRQREQIQRGKIVIENNEAEERNIDEPGMRNDEDEQEIADAEELAGDIQIDLQLTEKDKELERFFIAELEQLEHSSLLRMEPRQALPKVKMDSEIQERANKVLRLYLPSADTIPEITDIIYSTGKAVGHATGVKPKERNENGARKAEGGNRRERKLKTEMKRLRQDIARAGNELHRRKQQRKATKKEKEIIKHLRTSMNGQEVTPKNLRVVKEQWLDKLRYKKVKLEKWVEKRNRKKDNIMFQKDKKNFFRALEKVEKHEGEMPEMDKFVEFWGDIWEQNEPTPNMPWMEEVKAELNEKAKIVSQFEITEEKLRREASKRKNWTAPGIDGIQNFWWKKFIPAQKALAKAFTMIYEDTTMIPEWWPSGRTVLLPKTKNLSDEKNYRQITCMNTSYKILTGLVTKHMRQHVLVNEIWDKGQLGAVEGVLGTGEPTRYR